ncbi:MAG: capsule assembly Wzi family protein [Candidatus Angelobacter sp. Gp1-AA117]|nr:MAG: capsule assembly Wzi family protein [Candidatus Angelobacter sp. Gp1-AA117]
MRNFAIDQRDIWTSPFKIKVNDLNWLLPMAGLTAGLLNADAELSSRIDPNGSFSSHSSTISNAGLAAAVAAPAGMYILGKWHGDDHQREAGILSGEAFLNAYLVNEVFKITTRRERPNEGNGQGEFFKGTISNSSFPSNHAMLTWSVATVLAHEYPGPLTKTFAYGFASLVSLARVTGRNHFPSDVVVGSTLGYLIGRQVYSRHHDPQLWGAEYGTFDKASRVEHKWPASTVSSPYVPLDSWVYPAFSRLAALGVAPSGIFGLRPWTRYECARLLEEAEGYVEDFESSEVTRLYAALAREFAPELKGTAAEHYAQLDSVYARVTGISGQPLTDGYHFAKTIVNDYGRPYQEGTNFISGFSSSGSTGPFGFYVRGELEHAPSAPGVSQTVQNAIQVADQKPLIQPAFAVPAFNQFRLLDTYVMLNLNGWQTSFGKQTLWTGPTQDPFLSSNNAQPMYMLRFDQTTPRKLPSFLGFLGPYRMEFWVGKLTGQHFVATQDPAVGFAASIGRSLERQPMLNGQKVNFHPTKYFEFGVGKTGLWGGPDFPITGGTTRRSLFGSRNATGRGNDPGDRRSSFDFSYRLPGLRNWFTLYDDSFVEDEISPIGYPRRSAHNPGIYMPQLPGLHHMDLRVEASYTNLPDLIEPPAGGFFYWNTRYLDGYTSKGDIIGNGTVGRQGIAYRGESTYWFASDKTIQAGYRTMTADFQFLQGGNLRDVFVRSEWSLNEKTSLSSLLQYEWWNFPLLSAGNRRNDFTASFQLTYWPHWKILGGK